MPRKTKQFWIWVGILLLVELAAITMWKRWYWFFPSHAISEAYSKYEGVEGVNAAFFKDFRINDSVFVDVTLLEATDSAGWGILCNDFKIPVLDSASQSDIDNGMDLVFTKKLDGNDYSKPITDTTSEIVVRSFSYLKKSVCIFHTKNKAEEHAVLFYNFDYSAKQ